MRLAACVGVCLGLCLSVVGAGCGAGMDDGAGWYNQNNNAGIGPDASAWQCYSANDCAPGQYCNEFHVCVSPPQVDGGGVSADAYVPPETELVYHPPASGDRYVFVALTDQDTVARIDSETLDIDTIAVGDAPDILVTAPGQDVALVLNQGSSSISIIRSEGDADTVLTLPTPPHFNRLAASPDGRFAVAWFELDNPNATGVGSFQDVSVIHLEAGAEQVVNVSVGFRPRQVQFAPDSSVAWVITEDGVSILELDASTTGYFARTVPLTLDPLGDGDPDEVVVTPDGQYALARWAARSGVRVVNLQTEELVDVALVGSPTDLDLTPAGDQVLAVVREEHQVALLDLPEALTDASSIQTVDCTDLVVGSAEVTPDGQYALLYSNAINQKLVSLLDLTTLERHTTRLRKGVRWIALAPDGHTALVLHNKIPGDPQPTDDVETVLDKRYGFSLVNLDTLFVKLQVTPAEPGAFAFSPDESAGYLIVADPLTGVRDIDVLDLASFVVTTLTVGSNPVEIGPVAGTNRIYVSQEHPLGRISFVDVVTGQLRTVTGFQLNSQVIE